MKNNENKELGLGWHNFMVFCRGFTGVVGIIVAIALVITSALTIQPIGSLLSIAYLAVAIYSLNVRNSLRNFEEEAPKKLITYNIVYMILSIADTLCPLLKLPLGSGAFPEDGVGSILDAVFHAIIMIAINSAYYKKREDMFVN